MSLYAIGLGRRAPTAALAEPALTLPAELALVAAGDGGELIVAGDEAALAAALERVAALCGIDLPALRRHLVVQRDASAAERVFRLACGAPSMLAALRQAEQAARAAGTLGATLQRLFQRAYGVARAVRLRAAGRDAAAIVAHAVERFMHWLDERSSVPLIRELQQASSQWRAAELERARRSLALGMPADAVMDRLSRALVSHLLHGSYLELRGGADAGRVARLLPWGRLY